MFSLSNRVRVLKISQEQEQRSPREYILQEMTTFVMFSMAEGRLGVMIAVCEYSRQGNAKKGKELLKLMGSVITGGHKLDMIKWSLVI